jgi:CRP-like cAMP-binding protein
MALRIQTYNTGDHVISEGEPADKLYIVKRGVVDITKGG